MLFVKRISDTKAEDTQMDNVPVVYYFYFGDVFISQSPVTRVILHYSTFQITTGISPVIPSA